MSIERIESSDDVQGLCDSAIHSCIEMQFGSFLLEINFFLNLNSVFSAAGPSTEKSARKQLIPRLAISNSSVESSATPAEKQALMPSKSLGTK